MTNSPISTSDNAVKVCLLNKPAPACGAVQCTTQLAGLDGASCQIYTLGSSLYRLFFCCTVSQTFYFSLSLSLYVARTDRLARLLQYGGPVSDDVRRTAAAVA